MAAQLPRLLVFTFTPAATPFGVYFHSSCHAFWCLLSLQLPRLLVFTFTPAATPFGVYFHSSCHAFWCLLSLLLPRLLVFTFTPAATPFGVYFHSSCHDFWCLLTLHFYSVHVANSFVNLVKINAERCFFSTAKILCSKLHYRWYHLHFYTIVQCDTRCTNDIVKWDSRLTI